jgi:hypothetical protein
MDHEYDEYDWRSSSETHEVLVYDSERDGWLSVWVGTQADCEAMLSAFSQHYGATTTTLDPL